MTKSTCESLKVDVCCVFFKSYSYMNRLLKILMNFFLNRLIGALLCLLYFNNSKDLTQNSKAP